MLSIQLRHVRVQGAHLMGSFARINYARLLSSDFRISLLTSLLCIPVELHDRMTTTIILGISGCEKPW
ncbi:hypothetical protein AcV7_001179 [Taiwanofungus camphoratus]|nr:hypothetical protein AcV7_001179 [Antrodia cinnamomea]